MIVYKKTDEWQLVATNGTTSDNEWQRVTTNDNEWQRMTTNDNEWQRMTTSNNKWQSMTTNDNEWQRVVILANFPFFQIREEPTTMHPKETL